MRTTSNARVRRRRAIARRDHLGDERAVQRAARLDRKMRALYQQLQALGAERNRALVGGRSWARGMRYARRAAWLATYRPARAMGRWPLSFGCRATADHRHCSGRVAARDERACRCRCHDAVGVERRRCWCPPWQIRASVPTACAWLPLSLLRVLHAWLDYPCWPRWRAEDAGVIDTMGRYRAYTEGDATPRPVAPIVRGVWRHPTAAE